MRIKNWKSGACVNNDSILANALLANVAGDGLVGLQHLNTRFEGPNVVHLGYNQVERQVLIPVREPVHVCRAVVVDAIVTVQKDHVIGLASNPPNQGVKLDGVICLKIDLGSSNDCANVIVGDELVDLRREQLDSVSHEREINDADHQFA